MLNEVKRDLENHYDWNYIYYSLSNEEYDKVKELVRKDYGFLDIVLEFDDYEKLDKLKNNIPQDLYVDMITSSIIEQYVNYKIVKQLPKNRYADISRLENELFSGDFDVFKNSKWLFFYRLEELLKKEALKCENKYARILVLLDSIDDIDLQRKINDLIVFRTNIAIMGYTTKEDLLIYGTTNNVFIEDPHDYISKIKKIERRY